MVCRVTAVMFRLDCPALVANLIITLYSIVLQLPATIVQHSNGLARLWMNNKCHVQWRTMQFMMTRWLMTLWIVWKMHAVFSLGFSAIQVCASNEPVDGPNAQRLLNGIRFCICRGFLALSEHLWLEESNVVGGRWDGARWPTLTQKPWHSDRNVIMTLIFRKVCYWTFFGGDKRKRRLNKRCDTLRCVISIHICMCK